MLKEEQAKNLANAKFDGVTLDMFSSIVDESKRIVTELYGDMKAFKPGVISPHIILSYNGAYNSDGTGTLEIKVYLCELPRPNSAGITSEIMISALKSIIPYAACVINSDNGVEIAKSNVSYIVSNHIK